MTSTAAVWICIGIAAWLAIGLAVGVLIGRVARRRDNDTPTNDRGADL